MPPEENAWAPTARGREIAQAHLDDIARIHTLHPKCALCGQHAVTLDRFGLCSKTSDSHKAWRTDARADNRKARR